MLHLKKKCFIQVLFNFGDIQFNLIQCPFRDWLNFYQHVRVWIFSSHFHEKALSVSVNNSHVAAATQNWLKVTKNICWNIIAVHIVQFSAVHYYWIYPEVSIFFFEMPEMVPLE